MLKTEIGKLTLAKKMILLPFLTKIKKDKITMEQAKGSQEDFNEYLKTIRRGKTTEKQKETSSNINIAF